MPSPKLSREIIHESIGIAEIRPGLTSTRRCSIGPVFLVNLVVESYVDDAEVLSLVLVLTTLLASFSTNALLMVYPSIIQIRHNMKQS